MTYLQPRSNKAHLMMLLALLLGLGFLASTLIGYFTSRTAMRQALVELELPLTANHVYAEIQKDLARPILIASMVAGDAFLRDWVAAGEKDPAQLTRYLQEVQAHHGAVSAFFVSEATRNQYQSNGILKQIKPQEPRDRWYFRARDMTEPYAVISANADTASRDRLGVVVHYRVFDDAHRFIGVAGVGLAAEAAQRVIDDYQKRDDRQIFFADDSGRITLSAKYAQGAPGTVQARVQDIPGLGELAADLLAAHKGSFDYQASGRRYFVNLRYVPELKWNLFVVKQAGQGLADVRDALYLNWLLCAAVAAAVLLLVYWVVGGSARPLEKLSATDDLTGLASRQALDVLLHQAMLEAVRLRSDMAAVLLGVDHFKALRDRLGQPAADKVLAGIALSLQANLRGADIACRWGPEEFLVILKHAPLAEAAKVAENLRAGAARNPYGEGGNTVTVTVSVGVSAYRAGETQESFIARADDALYRARHAGGNRVCPDGGEPASAAA
jgi:diguanylate cyclase (GGDEF)-like protein